MDVEVIIDMNNLQLHHSYWVLTMASIPHWASHAKRSSRPIFTNYFVCSAAKGLWKKKEWLTFGEGHLYV